MDYVRYHCSAGLEDDDGYHVSFPLPFSRHSANTSSMEDSGVYLECTVSSSYYSLDVLEIRTTREARWENERDGCGE